jgi:hypothetical protein
MGDNKEGTDRDSFKHFLIGTISDNTIVVDCGRTDMNLSGNWHFDMIYESVYV